MEEKNRVNAVRFVFCFSFYNIKIIFVEVFKGNVIGCIIFCCFL